MDAQLKAKWVEALRSGEFKQVKNELESRGAFCCLGVLCKINGRDTNTYMRAAYKWVQTKITIEQYDQLVEMNDVRGKTFPEIADYIEANL